MFSNRDKGIIIRLYNVQRKDKVTTEQLAKFVLRSFPKYRHNGKDKVEQAITMAIYEE